MHRLGVYVHISVRYEVSMIKAVTGMAVHRCQQWWHWHWQCQWQWQWHMMDRAWLHRLITKLAKKVERLFIQC